MHGRGIPHLYLSDKIIRVFKPTTPDEYEDVMIMGFGEYEIIDPELRFSKCCSPPIYMAPEVFKDQADFASDVWSCGVLLYMLLCGSPPFPGENKE